MYYAVQSIHFNDRAPSLFWLSKSTAITTEYNFTHTQNHILSVLMIARCKLRITQVICNLLKTQASR